MLSEVLFKNSYSSGYNEPKDFFTEALIESCSFDLGLGFFSSSGIRSLAYGFALFVLNHGKMRVIINHILSDSDKKAIENGQKGYCDFEEDILTDLSKLTETLTKEDEHFFNCLSYLISIKRIEFIATISSRGGLGHDKYGIFTDNKGNKVAFIGSANFSKSALELNGETITVFSGNVDAQRVSEYEKMFNETWNGNTPHLTHIPLSKVTTFISSKFTQISKEELLKNGIDLRDFEYIEEKPISSELIKKIEQKEMEPRFPFPEERSIQKEAYTSWLNNGKKGIFAMATGSGKTVTALNCVLRQYHENGFYKVIVCVPTQALAIQWEKEALSFNFQNIVSTHTNREWKNILSRYTTKSIFDQKKNIVLITTYATFNRKDIQTFIAKVKGIESFIYIADEAHNVGSPTTLKKLPLVIDNRIGLSATPERIYDEGGSNIMYNFFNSMPPKYTYRFTMKQAIEENILCHYNYYPIFIELTDYEMEEYKAITNQLRKFIDSDTGMYKVGAEMLLLKRKRVIHKAENKKVAIYKLLDDLKEHKSLDYTFVFVPEGYEPDYSKNDEYNMDSDDLHIINEYAQLFKVHGYKYHNYISGIEDSPSILKSFADGDIQILLSMKCLDEGVDIPRAENAIFCSSTGNPRQFVQRRGRVLRKCKGKEKATIWDLIVLPPCWSNYETSNVEKNLFVGEVKRILNFAALADNKIKILYGNLLSICESLGIDMFTMLEDEYQQYN